VLDPRPDSEAVVDLALEIVKASGMAGLEIAIADIGTGSGILIATLLAELGNARGVATDISAAALAVASRNAEKLGVGNRVKFVATRGLEGCNGPFDLVVSNPPYIKSAELAGLERAVADYDPALALDGGADGLAIYREIARQSVKLQPLARLVVEVGFGQADDVEALFKTAGWRPVGRKKDLGGHIRAVAMEIHP
jgi:release factor glutamine methyltransferase